MQGFNKKRFFKFTGGFVAIISFSLFVTYSVGLYDLNNNPSDISNTASDALRE